MAFRVCFIGDSFVLGVGDPDGLGWSGRIAAAARRRGIDITAYNLGVRRETTADIARRWQAEVAPRLPAALAPELALVPWFVPIAALEIAYPVELVGELAELALGLCFIADLAGRTGEAPRRAPMWMAAAIAGGVVITPLVDRLTLGRALALVPEENRTIEALAEKLRDPATPTRRGAAIGITGL